MKNILKIMIGLCLAVTILVGSGITAKADEGTVVKKEWGEGVTFVFDGGSQRFDVRSTVKDLVFYVDDVYIGGGYTSLEFWFPTGWVTCKRTPNGEAGVYYYNSGPSVPQESNASSCSDHNYEWMTTREATATVAGEKAYQCTRCSHIESYAEVSGYLAFNEDAMKSIKNAAANGTVTIDTKMWVSFHKSVFDTLDTRKDVALTVNFKHEGKNYTTTIPAGADLTGLADEKGFCGFLNLMAKFGGSEVS